jgi:hypothetical protein
MLYYIYCIWVKTEEGVLRYYGHTENMTVRKGVHVSAHKRWVAAGKPERICEVRATRSVYVLEHEDWRMDVVDTIECETKDDARKKEGEYILKYDCVNMRVAGRTKQEWLKDTDYNRRYHEIHKEEKKEYLKQYDKTHKEQRKKYGKQYHETHKEEISAKKAEKVTCDVCGSVVRKSGIAEHQKTKKCLAAKLSQPITTNAITLSPNP